MAPEDEATEGSAAKTETQAARIRSFFPETWLWELYLIRYVSFFLSIYTARPSFEYYRQVYVVSAR